MKQEGLAYFSDTYLTLIGLLLFFGFFVGVTLWTFHKSRKSFYDKVAKIPLIDDAKEVSDV